MKRLWIIRHGLPEPAQAGVLKDFDRALIPQGEADVSVTAESIKQTLSETSGLDTLHLAASPAKRTQETAIILAKHLGIPAAQIETVDCFYATNAEIVLNWIVSQTDEIENLMIVGHNPSLSDICSELAHDCIGLCEAEGRAFVFECDSWAEIQIVPVEVNRCEP